MKPTTHNPAKPRAAKSAGEKALLSAFSCLWSTDYLGRRRIRRAVQLAVEAEREACARVADEWAEKDDAMLKLVEGVQSQVGLFDRQKANARLSILRVVSTAIRQRAGRKQR